LKLLRITTVPISLRYLLRGQLKHFSSLGYDVLAVSADGPDIAPFVEEEEVPHKVIHMSRAITPFQDLQSIWRLYRLLRKEKPDIIHSHTPKAGLIGMIAAYLARVPVRVHTVAGLPLMETQGIKRKVLIAVEKITYYFASKVFLNSVALEAFIKSEYYDRPDKTVLIANGSSNGIDVHYFKRTEELERQAAGIRADALINPNDKVAVFVGRITGDKGINELARAMKQLTGVKLLLIGPMEPELDPLEKETVNEIEHNPDIIWYGFQADVRPYLMAADFLVFPSYREGFPNVPMQAGALGLPSIVTDINGCIEIVEEGVNGLIIPPKNEEELTKAIKRMLDSPQMLESMKENARRKIVERFDRRVVWKAIEDEYNRLIERNV
jgi:glycosyltransferase involved in cell wall biosynthesis